MDSCLSLVQRNVCEKEQGQPFGWVGVAARYPFQTGEKRILGKSEAILAVPSPKESHRNGEFRTIHYSTLRGSGHTLRRSKRFRSVPGGSGAVGYTWRLINRSDKHGMTIGKHHRNDYIDISITKGEQLPMVIWGRRKY